MFLTIFLVLYIGSGIQPCEKWYGPSEENPCYIEAPNATLDDNFFYALSMSLLASFFFSVTLFSYRSIFKRHQMFWHSALALVSCFLFWLNFSPKISGSLASLLSIDSTLATYFVLVFAYTLLLEVWHHLINIASRLISSTPGLG